MKNWAKIDGALADYVDDNWLRESPVKRRLREETAKMPQAGMQISAEQGQQLGLLARAIGARRAVEVGTFTGYSALCVAEALPADGKLWCCDVSEEWTAIGAALLAGGRRRGPDRPHLGPALETLDALLAAGPAGQLDIAFIDADKNDYDAYYERCLKLVRRGGVILIDNVLWGGSVADPGARRCGHGGAPRAQRQAQERRARRPHPVRRRRRHDLRAEAVAFAGNRAPPSRVMIT